LTPVGELDEEVLVDELELDEELAAEVGVVALLELDEELEEELELAGGLPPEFRRKYAPPAAATTTTPPAA
jgi:hypothetical protein